MGLAVWFKINDDDDDDDDDNSLAVMLHGYVQSYKDTNIVT